jgi:hypothetical protein
MEVVFCPRCGNRREPGMGFCTQCGANLAEIEATIRHVPVERLGRGWSPDSLSDDRDQMAPFVTTGESRPAGRPKAGPSDPHPTPTGEAPPPDRASTHAFPRVTRPQAEARDEPHGPSGVWRPEAARTERIGPVQHGGAQAPWIRPAGPSEPALWVRPLALLGGAIGVGAAFLPWVRWNFEKTAFHFPVRFLATGEVNVRMVSVGVVVVALAGLGLFLSPIRPVGGLRRFIGFLVLTVPVLFATLGLQPRDLSQLFHELGIGPYVAALGALLLLFG